MNAVNFVQLSDTVATSGQPAAADFPVIAAQGYRTVINLAMPTSDDALPDEGAIVTGLGMNYVHIPVPWEAPQVAQFERFTALMRLLDGEKIWVHCALNMRVSCFMYLYRRHELGWPDADARRHMDPIWDPREYPAWDRLVHDVAAARG
jgi:protein tyrosine phosphatase (PTP) superfamily phosphohydrolase (DUF442 family)